MSRIEELMDLPVEPEILEQMAETTCLDSKTQERIQKLALDKISSLQDQANRSVTAVTAPIDKAQEKEVAGKSKRRHKRRKTVCLATLLAACALVVSVGTAAMATLSTDSRLLEVLHADSKSQIAQLNEMRTPIQQYAKADGYTVTVQEAISDRHNTWVLLEVEAPLDVVLDENCVFFKNTHIQMEHMSGHGYTIYTLSDDNPNDNKLSFVLDFSARKKLAGQKLTLQLGMLSENELNEALEITRERLLAKGPWEFWFELPEQDSTVTMWQWKTLWYQDESFLLQKIEVSPLSIALQEIKLTTAMYLRLNEEPVYVYLKDGTQLTLTSNSSGSSGLGMQYQYQFPFPLDLAEIDRIVYCDAELNW